MDSSEIAVETASYVGLGIDYAALEDKRCRRRQDRPGCVGYEPAGRRSTAAARTAAYAGCDDGEPSTDGTPMSPTPRGGRRPTKADKANRVIPVDDYDHPTAKRTNNPPAGLAHLDREATPTRTFVFDPHIDPQLQWAGKAEHAAIDVPAPSVHVHEVLSAEHIVKTVRRQREQAALFDVDTLDPRKAVEFYKHDQDWSNRMILGDSLLVMNSLLERERLAGKVQVVYMDPPYGVNYNSNFQAGVSNRSPKDGADEALTREPEMIQAYRDTWELHVHSYLTYLRDRLAVARELLADTGSVFVQIGEENLHRVGLVLDEVFGAENRVATITVVKTSGLGSRLLTRVADYILWYAKDTTAVKYRPLYFERLDDDAEALEKYDRVELADGKRRPMTAAERDDPTLLPSGARRYQLGDLTSQGFRQNTTVDYDFDGSTYHPGLNNCWKTTVEGLDRLKRLKRIEPTSRSLRYVRFVDDFPATKVTNVWTDTGAGAVSGKRYVVQTNPKIITRCVLMASDPGDLVLDPTCGSGTTAFACEQHGRRWITADTSRVALAIARERLLTAVYPYYELADPARGVDGGLRYGSVTRVTLGMLANQEPAEEIPLYDQPEVDRRRVRVSGPFTVEALSRYAVNPTIDAEPVEHISVDAADHVTVLLNALEKQGVPRPKGKPFPITSLTPLANAGALQAEGTVETNGSTRRFAVSLGPRFGAVTVAQVDEALRHAYGYDFIVFAGFAVNPDAQLALSDGKVGPVDVALLLANPDLLLGGLLRNTAASQTFRLYSSPDIAVKQTKDGWVLTVEGVDSYDAATGQVLSYGRSNVQAWFADEDYDGTVFRASQALFPVTDAWNRLSKALKGTIDAELVEQLHTWTSLPFEAGDYGRVAVRVITDDGNASEVVLDLPGAKR